MSVPAWPAELPNRVLASGFDMALQDNARSTAMERGLPKVRLKSTKNVEPVSCAIMIDRAGWARLRRFFEEETAFGSKPFWLEDQIYHGAPITTADGDMLTTAGGAPLLISAHWLVMFTPGSPPRVGNNRGVWFDASFQLIRMP